MTDWYYHDPIEGRVGPLPADQLRARYGERRIQLDTLVWHHGLRDWSTLERHADALDLPSITPDASLPPPLPRAMPALPSAASAPSGMGGGRPPPPPKKGMSGCLIAVLVAAAVSVPMVAILAAIAIPAYQSYVLRSNVSAARAVALPIQAAIDAHVVAGNGCPGNGEAGIGTAPSYASPTVSGIDVGRFETGECGIDIHLTGTAKLRGKHLWLERQGTAAGAPWICSSDLDAASLPATCRTP